MHVSVSQIFSGTIYVRKIASVVLWNSFHVRCKFPYDPFLGARDDHQTACTHTSTYTTHAWGARAAAGAKHACACSCMHAWLSEFGVRTRTWMSRMDDACARTYLYVLDGSIDVFKNEELAADESTCMHALERAGSIHHGATDEFGPPWLLLICLCIFRGMWSLTVRALYTVAQSTSVRNPCSASSSGRKRNLPPLSTRGVLSPFLNTCRG